MGFDEAGQVARAAQRYSRCAVTGAVQRGARQGRGYSRYAAGQACLVGDSFTGIRSACVEGGELRARLVAAGRAICTGCAGVCRTGVAARRGLM